MDTTQGRDFTEADFHDPHPVLSVQIHLHPLETQPINPQHVYIKST